MKKIIYLTFLLLSVPSFCLGQTVETIKDRFGGSYTGETNSRGQRHGSGVYTDKNGTSFAGTWENNLQHGIGIITDAEGNELFAGEFINGAAMYTLEELEGVQANRERIARERAEEEREAARRLVEQEARRSQEILRQLTENIEIAEFDVVNLLGEVSSLIVQGNEVAAEWLKQAAAEGDYRAQRELGLLTISGQAEESGIPKDVQRGESLLILAAQAGDQRAKLELEETLGWAAEKVEIVTILGPRCTSFGFEVGTDSHANCVMELQIANDALLQAKQLAEETQRLINSRLDEFEDAREKDAALSAANAEAERQYLRAQQREREASDRQRAFSRALLGIGAGLLNPSQSSNSGGMLQTCYYNVGSQTVPYPVSSTSICPPSRDFGGVTGFLQ